MRPKLWADGRTAAQAVRRQYPAAAQATLERARQICAKSYLFQDHWEMERTEEPVCFPDGIDWALCPKGDPEWTYAMNRHTTFVNLGKAWCYTGEEVFARAFATQITDWMAKVPHTPQSEATTWRALEAGLRCENWLRALHLLKGSPVLTPALCAAVDESLMEHGAYLVRAHGPFQQLSNWGVLQDHGLFLLGLHFERQDWVALALERMAQNLHHALLPDGVQWEQSPMYHCEVLHCVADALLLARRNGIAVAPGLEADVHRMLAALAAWVKPDGSLFAQSDSDAIDARDLLALGAVLFRDGALRAAAGDALREENLWDLGPEAGAGYAALKPQPPAIASAALPASGNFVLRGGPGPQAPCLHLHGGSLGGGHGHADLLHIDLWQGGEDILVDAGRYTYVDGPARRELKSAAAHNTLRLDGREFTTYRDTWSWGETATPLPAEYRLTQPADYLCAGHLGYGFPVQRRIVYCKPDVIVLADLAWCGGAHTVEQGFHFGPGTLTVQAGQALWRGERQTAQLHFLSGQAARQGMGRYSPRYNTLCSAPVLHLATRVEGLCPLLVVICLGGGCRAELLPVATATGTPLPPADAQAVRIEKDGRRFTVVLAYRAGGHDAGLLCAGGCTGHGRALAFGPGMPQGIRLA